MTPTSPDVPLEDTSRIDKARTLAENLLAQNKDNTLELKGDRFRKQAQKLLDVLDSMYTMGKMKG